MNGAGLSRSRTSLKEPVDWPDGHVDVALTGAEDSGCIVVTVHGVRHYLHSTTTHELNKKLTARIADWVSRRGRWHRGRKGTRTSRCEVLGVQRSGNRPAAVLIVLHETAG
jgi:hypothetical protein